MKKLQMYISFNSNNLFFQFNWTLLAVIKVISVIFQILKTNHFCDLSERFRFSLHNLMTIIFHIFLLVHAHYNSSSVNNSFILFWKLTFLLIFHLDLIRVSPIIVKKFCMKILAEGWLLLGNWTDRSAILILLKLLALFVESKERLWVWLSSRNRFVNLLRSILILNRKRRRHCVILSP